MQYYKLDPALQVALSAPEESGKNSWLVFLHTQGEMPPAASATLEALNALPAAPEAGIYYANLSREAIDRLSEEPWVTHLRLSRQLRAL